VDHLIVYFSEFGKTDRTFGVGSEIVGTGGTKCPEESTVAILQIIKTLHAATLTNAVTSERAWVITTNFAQGKETLRFALCKRWPKQVNISTALPFEVYVWIVMTGPNVVQYIFQRGIRTLSLYSFM